MITAVLWSFTQTVAAQSAKESTDTIPTTGQTVTEIGADPGSAYSTDSLPSIEADSTILNISDGELIAEGLVNTENERRRVFNPDPNRAVWLSALFPGLGQVYNRRYWKLPLVVGGFMGLGYATSWNNGMLNDYTRAYRDLMDSDPSTNSYMNMFPSTTKEEDLDKKWLENILKSRKNYFRRNRDLCIICIIGVYFIAMVDAYVDASLSHFDISDNLAIDWAPTIIPSAYERGFKPSVGLQWAFRF